MYGLDDNTIKSIADVFAKYPQIQEVILYGSRARGDYREGSDIDLTIKGDSLDNALLYRIEEDIEDLSLPYLFDICIYSELRNPQFIHSIDTEGVSFS